MKKVHLKVIRDYFTHKIRFWKPERRKESSHYKWMVSFLCFVLYKEQKCSICGKPVIVEPVIVEIPTDKNGVLTFQNVEQVNPTCMDKLVGVTRLKCYTISDGVMSPANTIGWACIKCLYTRNDGWVGVNTTFNPEMHDEKCLSCYNLHTRNGIPCMEHKPNKPCSSYKHYLQQAVEHYSKKENKA